MGNTFTHRNSILSILKTSKQLSMPKQVNISKQLKNELDKMLR